jgi:hypothetical protein
MTPTAELTPSKPIIDSIFGNAVAVDGDAVAVGQAYKNHAYVFVKPVAGWTNENETAELSPTGAVTLTSLVSQSRFDARLWWSASPRLPIPAAPLFVNPWGMDEYDASREAVCIRWDAQRLFWLVSVHKRQSGAGRRDVRHRR